MASKKKAGPQGSAATKKASPGWVDETVPSLARLLAPHRIDAAAFSHWIGPKLGYFRAMLEFQEQSPTAEEERGYVTRLHDAAGALAGVLRSAAEPDIAAIHLFHEANKIGVNWSELRDRLRVDLERASDIAELAGNAATLSAGGRPSTADRRDKLFAAVIGQIQALSPEGPMKVMAARSLAHDVLVKCGVPAWADLKRSHVRGQKLP